VTEIGPIDPHRPIQRAEHTSDAKPREAARFERAIDARGTPAAPAERVRNDDHAARIRRTLSEGAAARLERPQLLQKLLESEMKRAFGSAASPGMLTALERAFRNEPRLAATFERMLARTACAN
jgi:hypothetical protein